MELSIKNHLIKSGWSIIYVEESPVIFSKNIVSLSLKMDFVLANSAHPYVMLHIAAFHLVFTFCQSNRL